MKQLTIVSGKGGVGKSSITASLAIALARKHSLFCVDCDVDAPNLALVFGVKEKEFKEWKPIKTNEKARIIEEKCIKCRKCIDSCYFNAISWDKEKNIPVIDGFSCEGCGVCGIVCPGKAIELEEVENARIGYGETGNGFSIFSGQLNIGEAGSGKVVAALKELAKEKSKEKELMLVDAPAGIGCPVIASIAGSSYVIAVTEPTPAGLSDLKRVLEVANHFRIKHGIIINKHDLNPEYTKKIAEFAEKNGIEVLARIPYDKRFVEAIVNLTPIITYEPGFEGLFKEIVKRINI